MQPKRREQQSRNRKYVEPYDFKHPKLFSKEIMRNLRSLHDMLARNLSRVFSSALRRKVDVSLHDIEQLSTSEFINKIESPSVIYLLEVNELGGNVIIDMPPGFCIHLIERQSGGYGEDVLETRTLTTIEEKITSRIMNRINQEIIVAWEPYMDFKIDSTTYESKPENIHLVSVDPTIIVKFRIEFGEQQVQVQISYPYSLLKEAMNNSALNKGKKSQTEELTGEELESYKRTLYKATVRIQPLLGKTRLTIDEISNLEEGDTIPLSQRTDKPLDIMVNDVKKMSAYPGVVRGRRAVKIFEMIEEINEEELI
ncbi:flagellar motor switch protein FliM [Aliifodinibius sp. S!AR15-10]|uniref:flagellar motor switch protein FliM n=1 Tax=Aliifodinibius sp. S!AR15-10 TaxID=2950437 RepID=UPI0028554ABA|nr:FliM/FliN family flagellar motor switch protein [Aliifodinibius sp. S!AR15-10]MDR8394245.1 flagellar motor switch protein FliM [Aliifodinibius sp. S!AR15-10]